jgi:hypothetical protein
MKLITVSVSFLVSAALTLVLIWMVIYGSSHFINRCANSKKLCEYVVMLNSYGEAMAEIYLNGTPTGCRRMCNCYEKGCLYCNGCYDCPKNHTRCDVNNLNYIYCDLGCGADNTASNLFVGGIIGLVFVVPTTFVLFIWLLVLLYKYCCACEYVSINASAIPLEY